MEEERVVGLSVLHEPMHGAEDVGLGRLAHRVLLVVGKDDHVLSSVAKVLVQIRRHIPNVVDAAPQLPFLAKVVDSNQQGFSLACTVRVLETVSLRRSVPKRHGMARRGRRGIGVPLRVRVVVHSRNT